MTYAMTGRYTGPFGLNGQPIPANGQVPAGYFNNMGGQALQNMRQNNAGQANQYNEFYQARSQAMKDYAKRNMTPQQQAQQQAAYQAYLNSQQQVANNAVGNNAAGATSVAQAQNQTAQQTAADSIPEYQNSLPENNAIVEDRMPVTGTAVDGQTNGNTTQPTNQTQIAATGQSQNGREEYYFEPDTTTIDPNEAQTQEQGTTVVANTAVEDRMPVTGEEQSALADIPADDQQAAGNTAAAAGQQAAGQNLPQTGLLGYEDAQGTGLMGGITAVDAGQEQGVNSLLNAYRGARDQDYDYTNQAVNALNPFLSGASGAQNQQAALSGALGPEAQAAAFAAFQESPGQKYLREQTERGVLRNAAAMGGIGGGNVMRALQENAMGLAQQDFQNQFNRLGTVADRGVGVAGAQANLLSGVGGRQAQLRNTMGTNIANMQNQAAQNVAGMIYGTGQNVAQNRMRVGQDIAANIDRTTQNLAAIQGGEQLANLLGGDTTTMVNLITAAQNGDAAALQELSTLLSNINQGAASNVVSRTGLPGIENTAAEGLKAVASLASGGGTAMGASG